MTTPNNTYIAASNNRDATDGYVYGYRTGPRIEDMVPLGHADTAELANDALVAAGYPAHDLRPMSRWNGDKLELRGRDY